MEHFIKYGELAGYIEAFRDQYGIETLDELYDHLKEDENMKIVIVRG